MANCPACRDTGHVSAKAVWITSKHPGDSNGTWHWPERANA